MIFQQKFLTSISQNEIKCQLERESEERKRGKVRPGVAKWESEERKGGKWARQSLWFSESEIPATISPGGVEDSYQWNRER